MFQFIRNSKYASLPEQYLLTRKPNTETKTVIHEPTTSAFFNVLVETPAKKNATTLNNATLLLVMKRF
jgi:hypothetical protein